MSWAENLFLLDFYFHGRWSCRGVRAQARKSRNTALGFSQCLKPSIPRHGIGFPKAEQKERSAPGMPTALATYCRVTSQHRHGGLRWVSPLPCCTGSPGPRTGWWLGESIS